MNSQDIRDWGKAHDLAEASPITANLPPAPLPGDVFAEDGIDGIHRKWLAAQVVSGNSGARWAYWAPWNGVGPHPEWHAIADTLFNGDAAHFIGMLGIPYTRIPGSQPVVWVMVSPRAVPPPSPRLYEEKSRERYEKSKEVYDVESGQTRLL